MGEYRNPKVFQSKVSCQVNFTQKKIKKISSTDLETTATGTVLGDHLNKKSIKNNVVLSEKTWSGHNKQIKKKRVF